MLRDVDRQSDARQVSGMARFYEFALCSAGKRDNFVYLRTDQTQVAESDLLRDVLYILQGIDGQHVRFAKQGHALPASTADGLQLESGVEIIENSVRWCC